MKIGIVSDSHGESALMKAAMELLRQEGVDCVVHCGDIGSVECLQLLKLAGAPAFAVGGNDDLAVAGLEQAAEGVTFGREEVRLLVGTGLALAVTHGNDPQRLDRLITGGRNRYVCHGHTHRARDSRIGTTRVINPGALCEPLSPQYPSVAILDTASDAVENLPVPQGCQPRVVRSAPSQPGPVWSPPAETGARVRQKTLAALLGQIPASNQMKRSVLAALQDLDLREGKIEPAECGQLMAWLQGVILEAERFDEATLQRVLQRWIQEANSGLLETETSTGP